MLKYHKINSIFKRDRKTNKLIEGVFSLPEFEYLQHNNWIWREKIDGTNTRIEYTGNKKNQTILFGGKDERAQLPAKLVNHLVPTFYTMIKSFKDIFSDAHVCLYGEGYGKDIQSAGKHYGSTQSFILFDVNIDGWWLEHHNVKDIAKKLNIQTVPIIGKGTIWEAIEKVKEGFSSSVMKTDTPDTPDESFIAEGIVATPEVELNSRGNDRIITKIKYKDFIK